MYREDRSGSPSSAGGWRPSRERPRRLGASSSKGVSWGGERVKCVWGLGTYHELHELGLEALCDRVALRNNDLVTHFQIKTVLGSWLVGGGLMLGLGC